MPTTPATNSILVIDQTIEINNVANILVSAPTLDANGDWVRQVQVFRQQDPGVTNSMLVLTVTLKGTQLANINFTAPGSEY
jgi:hypothetical protein